jgi:hypothetical protein
VTSGAISEELHLRVMIPKRLKRKTQVFSSGFQNLGPGKDR